MACVVIHLARNWAIAASVCGPHGIEDLQTRAVFYAVGHHDAAIRFRDCGDDPIEGASWHPLRCAVGHQARPDQTGLLVEGKNAAGKQSLRTQARFEEMWNSTALRRP